jgi:hypothetical protein
VTIAIPTLADEVLAALPVLFAGDPRGPTAADMAVAFGADLPSVRNAMAALEEKGHARLVRRGRSLHLVPAGYPGLICPVCRGEFVRKKKSRALTCSRSCAVALSWRNPEVKERRGASISATLTGPEHSARITRNNHERWSRPGEREKLSEQNRRRWADPETKVRVSLSIQREHGTPEKRALYSRIRKAFWDDPAGRKRMVDGIRRSKSTPEAKAKFSALLKARWQDPVMRAKYIAGNRRRAGNRKGKKQSAEHVRARVESTQRAKRSRSRREPERSP